MSLLNFMQSLNKLPPAVPRVPAPAPSIRLSNKRKEKDDEYQAVWDMVERKVNPFEVVFGAGSPVLVAVRNDRDISASSASSSSSVPPPPKPKRQKVFQERLPRTPRNGGMRDAVFAQLDRDGYCIIPNVIDSAFCDELINDIWQWMGALQTGIKRDDPETWTTKQWPANIHGIIQHHGIGQATHAWKLRQDPRVVQVFADLWQTKPEDLLTSFDGTSVIRPPELRKGHKGGKGLGWQKDDEDWYHSDQRPTKLGRHCIQGWVTLEDVGPQDATLRLLAGSHLQHQRLKKPVSGDWYRLDDAEKKEMRQDCEEVFVSCPKGSMVLWDSRTVHCAAAPRPGREAARWRYVIYTCMHPRRFATEKELSKKRQVFLDGRTSSHWPSPVKMFPKVPRSYGKELPPWVNPPAYPLEQLTPLGKRLAGF